MSMYVCYTYHMEEYTLPSIIKELVIEYHKMESGDFIENHTEAICLYSNFIISRKSLKHIVEQRKTDKYYPEETKISLISSLFLFREDGISLH